LILRNGRIATLDGSHPFAEAVGVQNGRFSSVDSDEEIMGLRGGKTSLAELSDSDERAGAMLPRSFYGDPISKGVRQEVLSRKTPPFLMNV
jgi:hypothetical protein